MPENRVEMPELFFACAKAGTVPAPKVTRRLDDEAAALLAKCGARVNGMWAAGAATDRQYHYAFEANIGFPPDDLCPHPMAGVTLLAGPARSVVSRVVRNPPYGALARRRLPVPAGQSKTTTPRMFLPACMSS
ncbi:long-chain fatty acid--CoA ligase [Pseudonocardia sp. WMMC193]|uniref:long-chain fatty acid--CoA ligase n=1 Tax=Pseudonocardia sp. WMMC193 TaxID=2911965 RepID=UPI001F1E0A5D|nr:long-chain fatty acid--CoA ligase [Pseudonocardia sp. WMMC193]MCF7550783.1 long-chain fatty acid--CoA ligase [Pseudonocardia sp. WMMC193]